MDQTIEQTAQEIGIPAQDLIDAGRMSNLCGVIAGLKYLDWLHCKNVYFERVESGYYDKLEKAMGD